MFNKVFKILICILISFTLVSCKDDNNDIVIIYTSDVHGNANQNLGFASILSLKENTLKKTPYVTLLDCGDTYAGSAYSQMSKGEAIVECLNLVGYDYLAMGNHEFDFGIDRFEEIAQEVDAQYLNSNIVYINEKGTYDFINNFLKYDIVEYGDTKVGYISVDTPATLTDTNPTMIKEDGEYCLDFYFNDDINNFFSNIQDIIDETKKAGADYVVCLSHLGYGEEYEPYSSNQLANNTSGIDVIIDGHAHLNMSSSYEINKDGKAVIVTSCGTGIENIGYITISPDQNITSTTISNYPFTSEENKKLIDDIVNKYSAQLDEELFVSNYDLPIKDQNGVRIVRNRETTIGDLFADAFRYYGECDIAIMNGGGIRTGISKGSVSYANLIEIAPFDNNLAVIEVSGQELLDYLEYCYRKCASTYSRNGEAYGEDGSFMQVSGLKLTIDTSISSDVYVDEKDCLVSVGSARRLKDVYVLEGEEYVPIDVNKTYTVASTDYSLLFGGSGSANIFADNTVVLDSSALYSQVLIDYIIDVLNCDLSQYKEVDDRITVE